MGGSLAVAGKRAWGTLMALQRRGIDAHTMTSLGFCSDSFLRTLSGEGAIGEEKHRGNSKSAMRMARMQGEGFFANPCSTCCV